LVASVAATPMQGWTFLAWLGDSSDTNASVVVSMNRDLSLKAVFGTTLSVAPVGSGRVLADPSTTFVPYGSTVRLTALSQPGSYFVGWGGAASGNSNPIEVVASNANPSVSALFGALPDGDRTLTVTAHGHGHVTISSNAPYYANGTGLVLTAVPEPGQSFLSWSGDGSGSFSTLSVTLTTNKIILADFTARPQLQVSPLGGMLPQGFRASFVGQVGTGYRVLASTNLVTWDIIGAATNTLGTVQFNDPQATNQSARFYRAEVVP